MLKTHCLQKTSSLQIDPLDSLHAHIVLYTNVDAQCDKTGQSFFEISM